MKRFTIAFFVVLALALVVSGYVQRTTKDPAAAEDPIGLRVYSTDQLQELRSILRRDRAQAETPWANVAVLPSLLVAVNDELERRRIIKKSQENGGNR